MASADRKMQRLAAAPGDEAWHLAPEVAGVAGNLDATRLYHAAQALEAALQSGQPPGAEPDAFATAWRTRMDELAAFMEAGGSEGQEQATPAGKASPRSAAQS